jgi:hypothetical protein
MLDGVYHGTLTKAQRSGILERLEHNPKHAIAISFAATFPHKKCIGIRIAI